MKVADKLINLAFAYICIKNNNRCLSEKNLVKSLTKKKNISIYKYISQVPLIV